MSKVLERPAESAAKDPLGGGGTTSARSRRDGSLWWVLTTAVALLALIFGFVGLVLPRGGSGDAAADLKTEFDVEMGELFVKPSSIEVPAGKAITLHVSNKGQIVHDLKLNGTTGTKMLQPGEEETIVLPALSASAEAWCTVAGHKQAGMLMNISVAGAAAGAAGGSPSAAPPSNNAVFDPTVEFPADWKPFDPTLAPAPGGTEHTLELHATEEIMEVAPGVRQKMWTFGGQVPGPTLRGKVGDLFTITLINDGEVDHSIDFHASKVAWNDEMRSIAPGESLVYQFKAEFAGIYMYHCGTPPALHHIGNGMYGAIVVDPPDLPEVDHEYVLVQSEMYFGPMDDIGDLAKMKSEQWDTVVFNGYANQYLHAPIRVETGERIRVWVLDAGPSENSAFHIVGTVFDTVYKEGNYLLQPGDEQGGSQVLDMQPAQGGFVEFTFAEDGLYPIVTHKFANPGKGALGLFQAGEVDATGGDH